MDRQINWCDQEYRIMAYEVRVLFTINVIQDPKMCTRYPAYHIKSSIILLPILWKSKADKK